MSDKIENIGSYDNVKKNIENDNHEFIILPNAKNIGIIDFNKSLENLSIIIQKGKSALEQGFFIEFISLKIQYLEFYLKIYWVSKNPNNEILDENSRKFFGTLIQECKDYGFETSLIEKISAFNKERVKSIHKFLMGGITESELNSFCIENSKLGNELYNYVLDECGEFIDDVENIPEDVGSMIITRMKK
ncbi:MAG: hypothetical protein ACI87N_000201 [Flavobacteriales bacterium]|jgi:hypothetical protein